MLGDASDHKSQVGVGIETVELGRADQAVDRRRTRRNSNPTSTSKGI